MNEPAGRMPEEDLSVFDRIPSQTSDGDRRCLLAIRNVFRERGEYVYLEIGSYLGGTLQPHYAEASCRRLYSIDKRPLSQPDERGASYTYPENSTQTMRDNLVRAFPAMDADRLITFDADAAEVDPGAIGEAPDFCFIDGEHTNAALVSDMRFCLKVIKPDGIIGAHDAGVVSDGILSMKRELTDRGIPFVGLKPGGDVYLFAMGGHAQRWENVLSGKLQDEAAYFKAAAFYRRRLQREASLRRYPPVLVAWRGLTRLKDAIYTRIYAPLRCICGKA